MKYSELTHEERELVLFIQNNEKALTMVQNATGYRRDVVMQTAINYCSENCTHKDNWNDVFSNKNIKNVASYFENLENK